MGTETKDFGNDEASEKPCYTPIPLPQSDDYLPSSRRGSYLARRIDRWREKLRLSENGAKRDLLFAVAASLAINGLVVFALFLIVFKKSQDGGTSGAVEVTASVPHESEPKISKEKKPIGEIRIIESRGNSSYQVKNSRTALITRSIPRVSSVPENLPIPNFQFPPTLTKTDLEKVRERKLERTNQVLSELAAFARGQALGSGGEGTLDELFEKHGIGNGSDTILFVDVSASMDSLTHTVNRYCRLRFPSIRVVAVDGCALEYGSDRLISGFAAIDHLNRHNYVFITDLRDRVGESGISAAKRILIKGERKINFHVISFVNPPAPALRQLISRSGGTFTLLNTADVEVE